MSAAARNCSTASSCRPRTLSALPQLKRASAERGSSLAASMKQVNKIFGKPQKTCPGHAETSWKLALNQAAKPGVKSVHLNQKLSTITKGKVPDSRQPDVAVVYN